MLNHIRKRKGVSDFSKLVVRKVHYYFIDAYVKVDLGGIMLLTDILVLGTPKGKRIKFKKDNPKVLPRVLLF